MGKYTNWDDFCAIFPGKLTEEEFSGAVGAAETYIDALTGGRAEKAQGYAKERLKAAACALAEQMAAEKKAKEEAEAALEANMRAFEATLSAFEENAQSGHVGEAQLAEVSVDGYSEKYQIPDVQRAKVDIYRAPSVPENCGADMEKWDGIVRRWLRGTGLVSAI